MHITCVLCNYVLVWVSLKRKKKKKLFCKLYILLQSIHKECNCFILAERMVDIVQFGCLSVWKIL